jgi:hypothetical protein
LLNLVYGLLALAIIIALIGALEGLLLGMIFGWAIVAVLRSRGVTILVLPAGQLFVMAGLAGLAGIVAAIAPSRRAARLDILRRHHRVTEPDLRAAQCQVAVTPDTHEISANSACGITRWIWVTRLIRCPIDPPINRIARINRITSGSPWLMVPMRSE